MLQSHSGPALLCLKKIENYADPFQKNQNYAKSNPNFVQIMQNISITIYIVVVVDPKLLSSLLLYSQCQADESACLLQLV